MNIQYKDASQPDTRMGDAQYASEMAAMEYVARAMAHMNDALAFAKENSIIFDPEAIPYFQDYCGDNLPPDWEGEIRRKRNG